MHKDTKKEYIQIFYYTTNKTIKCKLYNLYKQKIYAYIFINIYKIK